MSHKTPEELLDDHETAARRDGDFGGEDGTTEALDAARAAILARLAPLVWTKEKPKGIGKYWYRRFPSYSENFTQIFTDGNGNLYAAYFGISGTFGLDEALQGSEWAGPIPSPVEEA